jgi:hypothetical protein
MEVVLAFVAVTMSIHSLSQSKLKRSHLKLVDSFLAASIDHFVNDPLL